MGPFWEAWYFHLPNYLLAAIMYTLVGRFLLGLLVPQGWDNYIWKNFCRLTDWAIATTAFITPRVVPDPVLLLLAAYWFFLLRGFFWVGMVAAGWAPGVGTGAP